MQNETPFSLLIWEDVSNLPFPDDIKPILKDIKWDEFEWHVFGLPIPYAKFTMSGGKKLYLSELPNENVKVREMPEFTGNIAIGGYFMDDNEEGYNYFIQFIITICRGEVVETALYTVQKQPVKEFRHVMADMQNNVNRAVRISNSWWFKWLYRPWFLSVRGVGFCGLFVTKMLRDLIVWVVQKLTPL